MSPIHRAEARRNDRFSRRSLCLASGAIGFFFLALGPLAAVAGTAPANLTVTLTVTAACTINATTLAFGSTDGISLTTIAVTASTTVSVTCTSGSPFTIGMGQGSNYGSGNRNMASGGNLIPYGLYTDPAWTDAWTTTTENNGCSGPANSCYVGTGTGSAQSVTIYGKVPTMATAPAAGSYTDTVLMTITY
jgi:spore coat protein U-like protein